jgi:hypothetical protein
MKILNADALSIMFGLFVGFFIPSIAMLMTLTDPYITAIWQAFPLWVGIAQQFHLTLVRRRSSHTGAQSGYALTQLTYAISFVVSAVAHAVVFYPRLNTSNLAETDWVSLRHLYVPGPPLRKLNRSMEFLQWDMWLAFGSSMLAALWFGRSLMQVVLLAVWQIVASVVLGPGAALAAIYMWREAKLAR